MPMDARKELKIPTIELDTLKNDDNSVAVVQKNGGWLSVPQFGDWDQKGQVPDYSLDFSKIRETRKQNKTNISRASLGNDEEFNIDSTSSSTSNTVSSIEQQQQQHTPRYHHQTHSPTTRKSFLSYFNCCVKS